MRPFNGDEDCLYLNIFKPMRADALPVIVFIHGGSNVRGSASQMGPKDGQHKDVHLYDGSSLAKQNVIVVTLNYRLGALGFIAHPKLSETSGYGGSGNYAYMDQIQALKWVQRNIAAFGGNPNNVTVFGQSAGAKGVWVLMTSPLSKGLFHRAIVHSAIREGARRRQDQEERGKELSKSLGCQNGPDELACMRGKSARAVLEAIDHSPGSGNFGGVVDGMVLNDTPIKVMERGQHHPVPILQGNVADELAAAPCRSTGALTCPGDIKTEEDYQRAVEKYAASIEGASAPELLRLYPSSDIHSLVPIMQ